MPITQAMIDSERAGRRKAFGSRYDEPESLVPQVIGEVPPGSVCRFWFMPNSTVFVVVGSPDDCVTTITPDGSIHRFLNDAWVIVLDQPRINVDGLLERIMSFKDEMRKRAWPQ